jgi:hypothetical protein
MHIDPERAAKALFDETFKSTLFDLWEEQPEDFKDDYRRRATRIASAALVEDEA